MKNHIIVACANDNEISMAIKYIIEQNSDIRDNELITMISKNIQKQRGRVWAKRIYAAKKAQKQANTEGIL